MAWHLGSGNWRNTGDDVLRETLAWFEDPLDFVPACPEGMEQESCMLDMLGG